MTVAGNRRSRRLRLTRYHPLPDLVEPPDLAELPDLVELPGRDVEHEAPDLVGVRDERAPLDPRDRLADVLVEVAEGLGRPGRLDPGVGLNRRLELVVGERDQG